jgi:hypothetical protein
MKRLKEKSENLAAFFKTSFPDRHYLDSAEKNAKSLASVEKKL